MAKRIPPDETVLNVVLTAAFSVLGRWNETYEDIDERRALRVLAEWHLEHLADRTFGTLSDGEQKRVQIARAVMTDPELLLLDEPAASLDLGAREELLGTARRLRPGAQHARDDHGHPPRRGDPGRLHARAAAARRRESSPQGPLAETLTAENLTETFGSADLRSASADGRYAARAASLSRPVVRFRDRAAGLIESLLGAFAPQTSTALAKSRAPLPRGIP